MNGHLIERLGKQVVRTKLVRNRLGIFRVTQPVRNVAGMARGAQQVTLQ